MQTRRTFLSRFGALLVMTAGLSGLAPAADAADAGPVVFAAASLKNALDDVNASWTAQSGKSAVISYAASSALAKQIENGAPADVFISADLAWMDELAGKSLIRPESRTDLLGNEIVLVAPKDATIETSIAAGFPLKSLLGGGKLAMANVDSVPAGKYGKAALQKLGVWEPVKDQVAQAENVRAALLLVSRGEAPLGIVYATDAVSDPSLKVVGKFPEDSHPPIVYPAAQTASSAHTDASGFLAYLKTPAAKALFEKQGFTVIGE